MGNVFNTPIIDTYITAVDAYFTKNTKNTCPEIYQLENEKNRIIESFEIENDGISKIYTIKLVVNIPSDSKLTEENMGKILGKIVQIETKCPENQNVVEKTFSGLISEVNFIPFKNNHQIEITLKPKLWLLTINNGYRAWIDKNTKEIISLVLKKYEFTFDFSTPKSGNESYLKRKNTIQYGESDYDFICRLMQEEGWNYIINQTKTDQELIFTDDIETYFKNMDTYKKPIEMQISHYNSNDNNFSINKTKAFLGYRHSVKIGLSEAKIAFADERSFGKPIKAKAEIDGQKLAKWEFHPKLNKSFKKLESSDEWAKKELSRKNATNNILSLTERFRVFSVGNHLKFKYSSNEKNNAPLNPDEYYISKLNHKYIKYNGIPNNEDQSNQKEKVSNYTTEIECYPIKEKVKYLENFTPNINIPRSVTATVFGKENEDPKLEIKDSGLMIAIKFFWQEKKDTDCSEFVWARLAQIWASKENGSLFIPQPGDEVLVVFDDDIDLPIVIYSLYNSDNQPPLKDEIPKDKNIIKNKYFIVDENQNFVFMDKNKNSSHTFNEKSLKTKISKDVEMTLDEKSLNTKIKKEAEMTLNDTGDWTIKAKDTTFNTSDSFKVNTKKAEVQGSGGVNINKIKIDKI